jgi:signal transduction histidine kinase
MGRVELAREGRDDEDLEAASSALERMETLIEDLLSLARNGQPISGTEPMTLSAVVDRTREVVDTDPAPVLVEDDLEFEADPDRLQQLLENLFRNAVKHGQAEDGATIRVGALDSGEGFYVADDGPGIPTEEREDVFSFGYSTEEGGTGFGLAIVREIAEAHGWTVSVAESTTGGARFEVANVRSGEAVGRAGATDGSG